MMNYKIIMKKNDFFKIHNRIATKNLEIIDDEVTFEVELGSLNIIKESGYNYHLVDSVRIKLQAILRKYYLLMIGILFLFSILYINSYRVTQVVFNSVTPINDAIEDRITSCFKKLFFYSFSNIDYDKISEELRVEYAQYPYIEVYNKNNKIYVDIYSYDDEYPSSDDNYTVGDIVAKKDGVIDYYYTYSGQTMVYKNKYVKKGDVLISSSINGNLVSSRGLVMAYTYEKVYIDVLKKESKEIETGESQTYYDLGFFKSNLAISKKNNYELYNKNEKTIFNLFDLFCVKKIEEKEKSVIIKENDEASAIEEAQKIIQEDFTNNKTNEKEEIKEIKLYQSTEEEDKYSFVFILKKLESIGEFKEV